jgi:hypothetical protein
MVVFASLSQGTRKVKSRSGLCYLNFCDVKYVINLKIRTYVHLQNRVVVRLYITRPGTDWCEKNKSSRTVCCLRQQLEVTIVRKVLPHPQRMAPCAICWITLIYKIPLCQDEIWGRMISMYWNESQCTIQQKHSLEIDYSSIISRRNNNLLELTRTDLTA